MRNNLYLTIGASLLSLTCAAARGDNVKVAQPLADGVPVQGTIPNDERGNRKPIAFGLSVDDRCIEELTFHAGPSPKGKPQRMMISVRDAAKDDEVFRYRIWKDEADYLFFPVLDRGAYRIVLEPDEPDLPYTLQVKRIKAELTDPDRAAARAAIERGTQWLLRVTPAKAEDGSYPTAVESLVMAALASDGSGKNDAVIDRDYLPWLTSQFRPPQQKDVTWNGQGVSGLGHVERAMYCHAIATLCLAETAPRNKAARALAEQAAAFLMAAQLTDRRPAAWHPAKRTDKNFGGWRYNVDSGDGDLSVSGWCVIALTACAAADVRPAGMRESLHDGVAFVRHLSDPAGFAYKLGDRPSLNCDAIGALVFRLQGQSGRAMPPALDAVDRNLFAGTQGELHQDYPLYYAYYATRLNYLRGSYAWEAWRMSAVRQLVKLQRPDGSWHPYADEEASARDRYATALSVMILRMCLDDVPAYMKQEVRGF